jgi:hypothetical protein
MVFLEGAWSIRLEYHQFNLPFFNFKEFIIFCKPHGLTFSGRSLTTATSRARTVASTCRSWFSSHSLCGVNCFSKQSAIELALSPGWNFGPEGPWMAVGALGPSLFAMDFAMGHISWDVTSVFVNFVYHSSSGFFRIMRVIAFETQITAVIPGFFPQFFKRRSRPGISFF